MHHKASIIRTLVTETKLALGASESLNRRWRFDRLTIIWISLLSFIMIKSALLPSLALLRLTPLHHLLLLNLLIFNIRLPFLIVHITRISFVFKWVIEAFESGVRFFALETQGTAGFI